MTFCPSMCFCSGDRAVLIDWEYALILPYSTSLARLIAHGEEDENAFFHMTQLDREFAIQSYFEHFIREKAIEYPEYRWTLDYFLLYEYCEWVAIGGQPPSLGKAFFCLGGSYVDRYRLGIECQRTGHAAGHNIYNWFYRQGLTGEADDWGRAFHNQNKPPPGIFQSFPAGVPI